MAYQVVLKKKNQNNIKQGHTSALQNLNQGSGIQIIILASISRALYNVPNTTRIISFNFSNTRIKEILFLFFHALCAVRKQKLRKVKPLAHKS